MESHLVSLSSPPPSLPPSLPLCVCVCVCVCVRDSLHGRRLPEVPDQPDRRPASAITRTHTSPLHTHTHTHTHTPSHTQRIVHSLCVRRICQVGFKATDMGRAINGTFKNKPHSLYEIWDTTLTQTMMAERPGTHTCSSHSERSVAIHINTRVCGWVFFCV